MLIIRAITTSMPQHEHAWSLWWWTDSGDDISQFTEIEAGADLNKMETRKAGGGELPSSSIHCSYKPTLNQKQGGCDGEIYKALYQMWESIFASTHRNLATAYYAWLAFLNLWIYHSIPCIFWEN